MKSARFAVVMTLLMAATVTLHMRGDADRVPPSEPLNLLPEAIGSWNGRDIPIDPEVLHVLGDGRFLNRVYMQPAAGLPADTPAGPVGLFIGYFPTQRTGQAIHSPQNCLPGAGWTFESAHPIRFKDGNGKQYEVGEYVITDGTMRQLVLYWYRAHGRSIANDYRAKGYMIADAIRYNRTDGALVRVITPLQPSETLPEAHNRAVSFASQMAPLLPPYIPD